ncbi:MAG TPA: neutral zinc metallopeptidase, partial [Vicinamibacterales bacterium]|nr:neutral zinc metallopeptidase [Vicinamibacterales bacterium]
MRWSPGGRGNIDDARGRSGLSGGVPMGIGGVLVLLVLSWATGVDFTSMIGGAGSAPSSAVTEGDGRVESTPQEERMVDFVDAVAGDTQDVWQQLLGSRYERTKVVLFRDGIQSGCGTAQSATGPFYCPGDHQVYLDLSFFKELSDRFGAPGDFAQAYVVAHEFGHHVQNLLGTSDRVRGGSMGENSASVALELQADCYAGIWGHAASQGGRFQAGHVELEPGDAEEALRAASVIGDDHLQKMATGRVQPERFTHGSSA